MYGNIVRMVLEEKLESCLFLFGMFTIVSLVLFSLYISSHSFCKDRIWILQENLDPIKTKCEFKIV